MILNGVSVVSLFIWSSFLGIKSSKPLFIRSVYYFFQTSAVHLQITQSLYYIIYRFEIRAKFASAC